LFNDEDKKYYDGDDPSKEEPETLKEIGELVGAYP
jgi:hypothetical protein